MNKKDKFVKLVELESRMRAVNRNFRRYVAEVVSSAMFVDEDKIPAGNSNELYNSVVKFIDWKMNEGRKPDWMK